MENINGQANRVHNVHEGQRDPKTWKASNLVFRLNYLDCTNFLLRYYLAMGGNGIRSRQVFRLMGFHHPRWLPPPCG